MFGCIEADGVETGDGGAVVAGVVEVGTGTGEGADVVEVVPISLSRLSVIFRAMKMPFQPVQSCWRLPAGHQRAVQTSWCAPAGHQRSWALFILMMPCGLDLDVAR